MKPGRKPLGYNPPVRVVVIMPEDMAQYLDKKAKDSGIGNRSGVLRRLIIQRMGEAGNAAS